MWTIPAERMKAAREHRVPLSPRTLEVLDGAAELFDGQGLVFPSPTGRVLNHAALTNLLHGLGIDAVAHGFRSSFRDWAAECTDAPREVCGLALALPVPHISCWTCHECEVIRIRHAVRRRKPWQRVGCSRAT